MTMMQCQVLVTHGQSGRKMLRVILLVKIFLYSPCYQTGYPEGVKLFLYVNINFWKVNLQEYVKLKVLGLEFENV